MLEKEISRRNLVRFSVIGAGATAALMSVDPDEAAAETVVAGSEYPNQIKIAHLSDTHYFSKKLYADCDDFTLAEHSDRKMFRESGAILDKALAEVVAYEPDVVIVSGDLTKDGELVCHEDVHEKLARAKEQLARAGKTTTFCVINGNHDINNDDNGRDFSSGVAEHTALVDPLKFKELYADCGYDDAIALFDEGGAQGGSLSYVLRPAKGITIIAVDSGKYSADQNGLDRDEHVTSGVVGERLLSWVESQAKQARADGDIVLVTQHHGVVPHFSMEPRLMGEYLVDNYEECQRRYADAGVSAVFTGHMHANDIASITTEAGNTLFDIETCSTVTYPSDIRFATLSWKREEGTANVEATLAVENHALGAVEYTDFDSGEITPISNITAYGNERLLTVDVIKTMIADAFASPVIDGVVANGGVKPPLAGALGEMGIGDGAPDGLNAALFNALFSALPQSKEEAITVELPAIGGINLGTIGIWSDAAQMRIMFASIPEGASASQPFVLSLDDDMIARLEAAVASAPETYAAKPWAYYITADSFDAFVEQVFTNVDTDILQTGKSEVLDLLRSLTATLLDQQVSSDGKNLFDLIKFVYGNHLHGDEERPAWAETAMANIKLTGEDEADGSLISHLRAMLNDPDNLAQLTELLKKVKLNLLDLLVAETQSLLISLALGMVNNAGALLGILGDKPAKLIPNIPSLAEFVHDALYSLMHDENQLSDRNSSLSTMVVDPDWKPAGGGSGSGAGNGSGTGNGTGNGAGNTTGNGMGTGAGAGLAGGKKPSGGVLPKMGDSTPFVAAVLMGVGALAAAFKAGRGKDDEEWETLDE